jgi:hypothetical protein
MVPESFEQNLHKACSAVACKIFQRKYINSVITLTLFQKELNLIVQSMYELRAEWGFVFAKGQLMACKKTTLYEEKVSLKKCNMLQSNDSSYSWRANIFYLYIYEW